MTPMHVACENHSIQLLTVRCVSRIVFYAQLLQGCAISPLYQRLTEGMQGDPIGQRGTGTALT